MEKERKPMTLGMVRINHPTLLDNFEALAKPYCTRLFDLGEEHKGIAEFIASGTFVRIGNRPGVLTNHHVAMMFDLRKRSWVYVPEYKSEKIQGLRLKSIISLPHYPVDLGIRGLDISFIELDSEAAVFDLGYQIWDLDKSAENHFSKKKQT
jgi:ribosomal protein L30/L7E